MEHPITAEKHKLTDLQLEFLKSLKYMASEKQLSDIKSLLRYYFARQLDTAIEKLKPKKGYTETICESWLKK